jgi:hypothetical protein
MSGVPMAEIQAIKAKFAANPSQSAKSTACLSNTSLVPVIADLLTSDPPSNTDPL